MKTSFAIASLFAAICIFSQLVVADDPPPFPGQPHLNAALKHLNSAKEKVGSDVNAALGDLDAARNDLAHAIRNKGTYQTIARQITEQAKQYVQKGDIEKATHKIDEAIENVNRAGKTGEH